MRRVLSVVGLASMLAACGDPAPGGGTTDAGTTQTDTGNVCMDVRPSPGVVRIASGPVGDSVTMVLDDHRDPAVAYFENNTLRFQRWDRCRGQWTAAITIDTVTNEDTTDTGRNIGLAFDAVSNRFGVVYIKSIRLGMNNNSRTVHRTYSTDGGATWASPTRISQHEVTEHEGDYNDAYAPVIAFTGAGQPVVAYVQNTDPHARLTYHLGDAAPARVTIPSDQEARIMPPAIAVDGAGQVGVAFWALQGDYNSIAYFVRPGSAPVSALTSNNIQNDDPQLALAFTGNDPELGVLLIHAPDAIYDAFFTRGTNGGASFSTPVMVPRDGGDRVGGSIAIAARTDATLLALPHAGGSDPVGTCGGPKLYRATDGRGWGCTPVAQRELGGATVGIRLDSVGRIHMVWQTPNSIAGADGVYYSASAQ